MKYKLAAAVQLVAVIAVAFCIGLGWPARDRNRSEKPAPAQVAAPKNVSSQRIGTGGNYIDLRAVPVPAADIRLAQPAAKGELISRMGAGRPERAFLHMRNGRIGGAALGDLFERGMIFPAAENIPSDVPIELREDGNIYRSDKP